MTSEDEISIAGSPSVTRRRLGSFNGQNASVSGKEEKSPGEKSCFIRRVTRWIFSDKYLLYEGI